MDLVWTDDCLPDPAMCAGWAIPETDMTAVAIQKRLFKNIKQLCNKIQ